MQLDYDVIIESLDHFTWFELLVSSKNRFMFLFSKITLGLQSPKLKKNLIICWTKLKAISHPWLGTPVLDKRLNFNV